MAVAYAHYTRFLDRDGNYISGRSYQNFFVGETRTFQSVSYQFAPFGIAGLSSGRNGDVGQSTLIAASNEVTVPLLAEAALERWLLEVKTVGITGVDTGVFTEGLVIASEVWACVGGAVETEKVTLVLSSPLDAARQEIPGRVLTRGMVGSIPPTGQIVVSQ